ncbi:MAG: hypothetical protein GXO78_06725 [Calditrichaeota bacterium]|nr:hypothetical protein [Calditrichota bacterium]
MLLRYFKSIPILLFLIFPVWAQFFFHPNFPFLTESEQENWRMRGVVPEEIPLGDHWLREWCYNWHDVPAVLGIPVTNPGNHASTAEERLPLQAIIEDFQVNENVGEAFQWNPQISMDENGNFVIVWYDERNGDWDIYAQRYALDGTPNGSNFKVNDDDGSAWQVSPTISLDAHGNCVIVWQDYRDGDWNIYAQRYATSGKPMGSNFKVNDDSAGASQEYPSVSMDANGNFVIVWVDRRNGEWEIWAQHYDSDGTPIGSNFKVNDAESSVSRWSFPSISLDRSGNFVIVWQDYRNGNADIYAQRYTSNGVPIGSNFKVNDDSGDSLQEYPSISHDADGNFTIVWVDQRNENRDIYAQRYYSDGTLIGANFKVNDDNSSADQSLPSISLNGSGNCVIVWQDYRNGNADIYAQCYTSEGIPIGSNFQVNDDNSNTSQVLPSTSLDMAGNFVIVWQDHRNRDTDIYGQSYTSNCTPVGSNFKINDDRGSARQRYSSISLDRSGNFVIVWEDYRNGYADIFAQRYTFDGIPIGSNFKVNDDSGSAGQWYPAISLDSRGSFVIVWHDQRNGDWDIYAQRYASDGTPRGPNFRVNDDNSSARQRCPSVSLSKEGYFVIAWEDYRNGNADIYAQRYDLGGIPIGSNFKVNDDNGSEWQRTPSISLDAKGNFVIAWVDRRNGDWDIYAQRYDSHGTPIGSNFKVNDDSGDVTHWFPSISLDTYGNFVIVWMDNRDGDWDIYGQRYKSNGAPIGTNFKVNEDDGKAWQWRPSISLVAKDNFVVVWQDNRNGDWDVYGQRYTSDGMPMGNNFVVTKHKNRNQFIPNVKLWNQRIYTTWTTSHVGGTGYDIWANVLDWNDPYTGMETGSEATIAAYALHPNYPNPFNPKRRFVMRCPGQGM